MSTLTDCMVDGSSESSSKPGSDSTICSFWPYQAGVTALAPLGIRSGPAVSTIRGPADRKTLCACSGVTRTALTCSAVSSVAFVVESSAMVASPVGSKG